MVQMNLQNRNRVTGIENKLMITKGRRRGGINWETGVAKYTLIYVKCMFSRFSCIRLSATVWTVGLPGSSVHGDSPGKNTEVGGYTLLQRIFPTQE